MTVPPIQGSPAGGKIKSQDEILRDTWNGIVKLCETNQPMDAEQIIRDALSYD